jgi:hypothetical protein
MRIFLKHVAKKIRLLALVSGLVLLGGTPALANGWQPNEDDSILLDLQVKKYRLGEGVRGYQTDKGVCVDLADMIIALDIPVRLDKKSRRATGWLLDEQQTFSIDREANTVQIMNKKSSLGSEMLFDAPEGWCVDVKALAGWLGVQLVPNLGSATLTLISEKPLPFELAEARKERAGEAKPRQQFNLDKLPQAKDPYRFWRTPSVDVVATLNVRKDSGRNLAVDRHYEILASGEFAMASFDARLASDGRGVPNSLRLRGYRNDSKGELLGPLAATQVALGDIIVPDTIAGTQSSVGRGAFVSNRPLGQPDIFDRTNFRGELPAGWDAELYRNGQLIGFSQGVGDGRYEFLDVQLFYGQNKFEVVLYGPQGQTKRDTTLVPVGADSIPPRETYYWAAVQETGQDLITLNDQFHGISDGWRAGFGVERGIDNRTSVSAAFTSSLYRQNRYNHLEGAIRRAIGPALVQVAAASNLANGYAVHGKAIAQAGGLSIAAEAALLRGDFFSERFEVGLRDFATLSLDQLVKVHGWQIPLRLAAQRKSYADGTVNYTTKTGLSFNISNINTSLDLRWDSRRGVNPLANSDILEATTRLSGRIGKVRLRGEANFELNNRSGLRQSTLTAEWRANDKSEWQAEFGYDAQSRRGKAGIGYVRQFDKFSLRANAQGYSDGSVSAGLNLAFSLGPKPGGGFHMSGNKLASRGQAAVLVYQDLNADGIHQADEPVEKSVEISAGFSGHSAPTGKDGMTLIEGLEPHKPILLSVDTSTLSDPYMQPANSGMVIAPRPGIAMRVELPLVSSGEISGILERDNGRVLSGVDLELVDKNGNVIKTTRSEIDGYFLFENVAYGGYIVRIAPLTADIIGVEHELSITAQLGSKMPTVELGVIRARQQQRIANAQTGPPVASQN